MPLLTWNESMSVRIGAFDKDHQKLITLLNQLFDAIVSGKGREVLEPTLDELVTYTKVHFTREENVFQRYSYPKLEVHRKEHIAFAVKFRNAEWN